MGIGAEAVQRPDCAFTQLTTERLIIRRFTPQDAATFSAYRSDPAVARYQSWEAPYSLEDARRFIEQTADEDPDTPGTWFQFAIVEQPTQRHIGDVAALCVAHDPRLATIGFTLAADAQGQGYGTEAVTALLDYLFEHRAKHRVSATCDARNTRSVALLERVGMRREAHHPRSAWWNGEWTDEYAYAVLATEWQQQRPPASARVADLPPRLFAQALQLWRDAGLTRPWNDEHEDLQRAIRGPASTVLACLDGERVIGTAMVGHDGHRGWVYYVAVQREEQGKGHGRRLMQACEAWLVARRVPKIQLMVREGNDAVVAFYDRLGYDRQDVIVLGHRLDG